MGTILKAIETIYKGYRFRSRLEARWAVFFDALDIQWEYEKEGYDLDGVWYLPDFWLPEQDCIVEIKGQKPTDEECEKAKRLARGIKKSVYILYGSLEPYWMECNGDVIHHGALCDAFFYREEHQDAYCSDTFYFFTECPHCGKFNIAFWGDSSELPCAKTIPVNDYLRHVADWWNKGSCDGSHTPRLLAAYTAARQARFEHGARP